MNAWKQERTQRIKYEARSSTKAFDIQIKEFQSVGTITIDDIKVKYFEVDHKPVKYAYGFNFLHKNNYENGHDPGCHKVWWRDFFKIII